MNIPFNKPYFSGAEIEAVKQSFENLHTSGCGPFTAEAESRIRGITQAKHCLLTTSCTHALEISAILLDLQPGDEVIVPSYTFVTSALAFMMHGAKPVFCDIRADTLNIDDRKIEALITPKTKAIVVVHYAGVACEMDEIKTISEKHSLVLIEDNAHGLFGSYKGKKLGSIGDLATQSFHETKNISCGEGGALLVNNQDYFERAEIIREKGTNRSRFFRGQVDKYTWMDLGSSYVISDTLAAILTTQLRLHEEIQAMRAGIWKNYHESLSNWATSNGFQTPVIPSDREQSFHMYYLLAPSLLERQAFIKRLKTAGISAVFHYIPLHDSPAAERYAGPAIDRCPVTKDISDRLIRLPFYTGMKSSEQLQIIDEIIKA
ncbi:MAG: dTDP-4-amino-4,6-dideoxygalactose transaminase [Acidiferrobacterales bacterium]|nr:dTDP-4-amino-4,6-dideoxygalactose transaminase [Acidiferrobacterales bacterium]